jgi:hypothetical protein
MKPDTMIDNTEHYVYDLRHQKGKGGVLEGNYYRYFVNKTDTIHSLPMFDNWEAYNLYNPNEIPSGIYTKKILVTPSEIVRESTISRVSQISKHFIIPKKCDYTIAN